MSSLTTANVALFSSTHEQESEYVDETKANPFFLRGGLERNQLSMSTVQEDDLEEIMIDSETVNDIGQPPQPNESYFGSASYHQHDSSILINHDLFQHQSSADESFLTNPYKLQAEIIRLKMELAQLQSSFDEQVSLTFQISQERNKEKYRLSDTIVQRDDLQERYDQIVFETMKIRNENNKLQQENTDLKRKRNEVTQQNKSMSRRIKFLTKKINDLIVFNTAKDEIISKIPEEQQIQLFGSHLDNDMKNKALLYDGMAEDSSALASSSIDFDDVYDERYNLSFSIKNKRRNGVQALKNVKWRFNGVVNQFKNTFRKKGFTLPAGASLT